MNTKTLIGGLIGGVVFFLLGWLVFGILLVPMMESHSNMSCMRSMEDMNMMLMVVANLLWGVIFAYIFAKANIAGFSSGAMQGALLAILIGLTMDLFLYSTTTLYSDMTVAGINILGNLVTGAIGGGIIGWWYGRK